MYDSLSLGVNLEENILMFKEHIFNKIDTIKFTYFENPNVGIKFYIIFNDGMVNSDTINESILSPLLKARELSSNRDSLLTSLQHQYITCSTSIISNEIATIVKSILYGDTLLLVNGHSHGILIDTKGWESRSISEPNTETSISGPKEGFTEALLKNISMVRRKIPNPNLKCEMITLGSVSKTKLAILYIDGLADENVLVEVKKRLHNIKVNELISLSKLIDLIEDHSFSIFRQIGSTERPDVISQKLTVGKVVILCDGTPTALTVPFLFNEYFSTNEDYYNNFILSSFYRILRYFCFFIGTSIPAIYISILCYHRELIPARLIVDFFKFRHPVPLSTFFETVVLLVIFQILKEGALRLPKHIGPTISIVGGLVIGDTIISAKFVSTPVIIVVALTELSSLILTYMQEPIIVLRFLYLICSSTLGLFGYIIAMSLTLIRLISLESFGVSYLENFIKFDYNSLKDTFFRFNWKSMYKNYGKGNDGNE